jgi:6-phosphogluconolactonase
VRLALRGWQTSDLFSAYLAVQCAVEQLVLFACAPPRLHDSHRMTGFSRHEHRFPDIQALVLALSGEIRVDLSEALAARGTASLIVSGGTTPGPLFAQLSREELDWSSVWIGLTDERWVDAADPQSNERLVRDVLLQSRAAQAHFVGLKNPAPTPESGVDWAWRAMKRLPRPYDVVVLGMGEDGHFASLVPNSLGVLRALEATAAPACVAMHSLNAPHPRVSQNLSALLDARRVVLMIRGDAKWSVYQRAKQAGPMTELPIRAVLTQQHTPVDVFWSP